MGRRKLDACGPRFIGDGTPLSLLPAFETHNVIPWRGFGELLAPAPLFGTLPCNCYLMFCEVFRSQHQLFGAFGFCKRVARTWDDAAAAIRKSEDCGPCGMRRPCSTISYQKASVRAHHPHQHADHLDTAWPLRITIKSHAHNNYAEVNVCYQNPKIRCGKVMVKDG